MTIDCHAFGAVLGVGFALGYFHYKTFAEIQELQRKVKLILDKIDEKTMERQDR